MKNCRLQNMVNPGPSLTIIPIRNPLSGSVKMDQDLPYFYNDNFSRNLKILDEIYIERSVIAAAQAVAGPHQCAAQRQAER